MMSRRSEEKIEFQVVVVSDIHLSNDEDLRHKYLIELIQSLATNKVECFVLLGDIFDFCFGAGSYFKAKFAALGHELTTLSTKGVRVIFVQGNHEFSLSGLGWKGIEFVTRREISVDVGEDWTLSFSHGDRLNAPWHYHLYSVLTRSFLFRLAGLMVPQRFLDKTCLRISGKSRMRSTGRRIDHLAILSAVQRWIGKIKCSRKYHHGIVGHFHCPYDVSRKDGVSGRLLCLKSWDQPNFLAFHKGQFYRYELQKESETFLPVPGSGS